MDRGRRAPAASSPRPSTPAWPPPSWLLLAPPLAAALGAPARLPSCPPPLPPLPLPPAPRSWLLAGSPPADARFVVVRAKLNDPRSIVRVSSNHPYPAAKTMPSSDRPRADVESGIAGSSLRCEDREPGPLTERESRALPAADLRGAARRAAGRGRLGRDDGRVRRLHRVARGARVDLHGRRAPGRRDRDDGERPRRPAARDRRTVRRDEGAARRVLPGERAEPG